MSEIKPQTPYRYYQAGINVTNKVLNKKPLPQSERFYEVTVGTDFAWNCGDHVTLEECYHDHCENNEFSALGHVF